MKPLHKMTPDKFLAPLAALGLALSMPAVAGADPTQVPAAWLAANPPPAAPGQEAAKPAGETAPDRVRVLVLGKKQRLAIVNGQVVHPGDTLGGAKVTGIQSGGVAVEDPDKSLKLLPGVEKRTPARVPSVGRGHSSNPQPAAVVKAAP